MATTTVTPSTTKEIRTTKTVFDLDSKFDVTLVKVGQFSPVTNMQEFVVRLGNDAGKILAIVNDGLESHERNQLSTNESIAWQQEDENENGETVLTPFSGTTLTEEKSRQLGQNVLNMAKMLFGYAKDMAGGKEAKRAAKAKAQEMLLSNPQVIEALKK